VLTINRDGERFCCEVVFEPDLTNARITPRQSCLGYLGGTLQELALKQEPHKPVLIDGLDEAVEASVPPANKKGGES
jgi:hypothetical protein